MYFKQKQMILTQLSKDPLLYLYNKMYKNQIHNDKPVIVSYSIAVFYKRYMQTIYIIYIDNILNEPCLIIMNTINNSITRYKNQSKIMSGYFIIFINQFYLILYLPFIFYPGEDLYCYEININYLLIRKYFIVFK